MLEYLSLKVRKSLRPIKKQILVLQSIRQLNKIQKLILFEMTTQATKINISRICCGNKVINLTMHDIGDLKSSMLFCTSHTT